MKQIWFHRVHLVNSPTVTQYLPVTSASTSWTSTEANASLVCPSSGTLNNLRVIMEGAPGAGTSNAFTLMVDAVASALTTTIADTDETNSDTSNSVTVTAGQTLSLRQIPTNTPTARVIMFTMVFTGDVAKESVIMGTNFAATLNSSTTEFSPVHGSTASGPTATEDDVRGLCAGNGTITNLYVILDIDPGTDPDAYRFTLRLNGISTTLTVTINANDITANDTVNSFTVAPGDLLTLMIEPLNTPSATPWAKWGVTFIADTDGESLLLGGSANNLSATVVEYNHILNSNLGGGVWGIGETTFRTFNDACVIRNMYVTLDVAPSAGDQYEFRLRVNEEDGNLVVVIAGTDTTGSDTVNSDSLAQGDSIVIESTPTSTPDVGAALYGFILFIAVVNAARGQGSGLPPLMSGSYI